MAKRTTTISFAGFGLDPALAEPLYRQLYDRLRTAILTRQLSGGTRLPSTRVLAMELNVSRNTVMTAFEQLLAEGYLEGKVGAGTFVTRVLPDDMFYTVTKAGNDGASVASQPKGRSLSRLSQVFLANPLTTARHLDKPTAFRPGMPAYREFPFEIWARLTQQRWQNPPPGQLGYAEPGGYPPLREAIAAYLWAMRGVRCDARQVIVVSGSQQALDLAARVLLDPDDFACIEDPGYLGARTALLGAGAKLLPLPIDDEGLNLATLDSSVKPRLVYVSPSHQYPLGVTMSLARRLALLEWANQQGAWILEDDYDSEYRYISRPLAALQGLDTEGRVIYFGTFSKVLFPSLRLGYLVVPLDLVQVFERARAISDRHSPSIEQAVITDFMAEGHFGRHIRRMRQLYAERQALFLEMARYELKGLLEVCPAEAGMHLMGWLPSGVSDCVASERAAAWGVEAPALSAYALKPYPRAGLLLGYAGFDAEQTNEGMRNLRSALETLA